MTTQSPPQEAATALLAEQMNRLRGRLLGMIEAVGFPARQEAGIKAPLKSLTYDAQADLAKTLEVTDCATVRAEVGRLAHEALAALTSNDLTAVKALLAQLSALEK